MDSDIIFLDNVDELMSIPLSHSGIASALDSESIDVRDKQTTPHFQMIQTGLFVAKPSKRIYNDMENAKGRLSSWDGGDQGFLTSYFAQNDFSTSYLLSSAYNYMKRGLIRDPEFDLMKIKVLAIFNINRFRSILPGFRSREVIMMVNLRLPRRRRILGSRMI